MGLKSNDWCHLKKRKERLRHTQRQRNTQGRRPCDYEGWDQSISQETPRVIESHQKLGRSKAGFFPRLFRESKILLRTWFWTSRFQNCERINFCCFKPTRLWILLPHPQEINKVINHPIKNISIIILIQLLKLRMSFPVVEMWIQEMPGRTWKSSFIYITYSIHF